MASREGEVLNHSSDNVKRFHRLGSGGTALMVTIFVCSFLFLLLLFVQVDPGRALARPVLLLLLGGVLVNLFYWLLVYTRKDHYIEVDEFGISYVTNSAKGTLRWDEIAEVRPRQLLPDAFLKISGVHGSADIRVYYARFGAEGAA